MAVHFGKFEGQPHYVEVLWNRAGLGCGEDVRVCGTTFSFIRNDESFIDAYAETKDAYGFALWHDEQGFVNCRTFESGTLFEITYAALVQEAAKNTDGMLTSDLGYLREG